MLLAEDLLLVTDDASGRLSAPAAQVDAGLGGANLVELTLRNKVDLSGEQDPGKPGRLVVRDPSTTGDAILDAALEIVLAYQAQEAICGALGAEQEPAADAVRAAGRRRGGSRRAEQDPGCRPGPPVAGSRCQPRGGGAAAGDPGAGAPGGAGHPDRRADRPAARARVRGQDRRPGQHGLSKRELRARAEKIAEGKWASQAVRKAIEEMMAAVLTATTAATIATTASAG